VIKETGLTDLKYRRHCFTGTYEELLEWRSLPHVRFGVTWKTVTDRASADSVARMETKEILLETDAPFLPPYPECNINHPWNLEVVAQEVGRLRNVPLSVLTTAINQNSATTSRFHG
jgi:Tat protein secretion system quality control protein TatD with DNase activity